MDHSKEENQKYNDEPVFYCKNCLSLRIRFIPVMQDSDYCDECGCTDIKEAKVEDWEKLYIEKYGHKYIEKY
jgi:hypothetical protein